jgi:hypothetical protein
MTSRRHGRDPKKEAVERAPPRHHHRRGGLSTAPPGDPGQGCTSAVPPPKVEPKNEISDEDGDYIIFYRRLGL